MPRLPRFLLVLVLALSGALPLRAEEKAGPLSLFDGKTLAGWKVAQFGGEGEVKAENGVLALERGQSMTGITYTGKDELPKSNYEVALEAQRIDGSDFFCGLTFPVKDSHCSFIVGGWGGTVVGLSSLDDHDASENESSSFKTFEDKKWYKIRVRVMDERIQCWINDERVVDQDIKGRKISTRSEVNLCKPLGVSTWETSAQLRNIQVSRLAPEAR